VFDGLMPAVSAEICWRSSHAGDRCRWRSMEPVLSPSAERVSDDGANSITVPGHRRCMVLCYRSFRVGYRSPECSEPPFVSPSSACGSRRPAVGRPLLRTERWLQRGGADGWSLFDRRAGELIQQTQLAEALRRIGTDGRDAFYAGGAPRVIAHAVQALRWDPVGSRPGGA